MAKHAIVVMSESGEANPGGQGRMLHAMNTVKELRDAGEQVSLWFHGIGVTWLTAFDEQDHKYVQVYRPLFDEIRDSIAGTCKFCTLTRFGAGAAAEKLGVPTVSSTGGHHTVAALIREGHQVLTF